jgi:hypothetical protein
MLVPERHTGIQRFDADIMNSNVEHPATAMSVARMEVWAAATRIALEQSSSRPARSLL